MAAAPPAAANADDALELELAALPLPPAPTGPAAATGCMDSTRRSASPSSSAWHRLDSMHMPSSMRSPAPMSHPVPDREEMAFLSTACMTGRAVTPTMGVPLAEGPEDDEEEEDAVEPVEEAADDDEAALAPPPPHVVVTPAAPDDTCGLLLPAEGADAATPAHTLSGSPPAS